MQRRHVMLLAGCAVPGLGLGLRVHAAERVLRVGVQKYGTLVLVKERGALERRLKPLGWRVTWTEYPAGPQ